MRAPRSPPDWRRHFLTHIPHEGLWICAGLPLDQAAEEGVFPGPEHPILKLGEYKLVGGCNQVFSRRDAYQRHLGNEKIGHIGDAWGKWMPGNRDAVRPSERCS